ncbi:hypothetical protein J6R97_08165 [bacterium]|nr:hypothetical protein [bacterium]
MVTINENAKLFLVDQKNNNLTTNGLKSKSNESIFNDKDDKKVPQGEEPKMDEASNEIPWWKLRARYRAEKYEKNKKNNEYIKDDIETKIDKALKENDLKALEDFLNKASDDENVTNLKNEVIYVIEYVKEGLKDSDCTEKKLVKNYKDGENSDFQKSIIKDIVKLVARHNMKKQVNDEVAKLKEYKSDFKNWFENDPLSMEEPPSRPKLDYEKEAEEIISLEEKEALKKGLLDDIYNTKLDGNTKITENNVRNKILELKKYKNNDDVKPLLKKGELEHHVEIQERKLKIEKRKDELSDISDVKLASELGGRLAKDLVKLADKNDNGNLNLTRIIDNVVAKIGADYELNDYHEKELAEIRSALLEMNGNDKDVNFTLREVKKLVNYFEIEKAKNTGFFKRGVDKAVLEGAELGAVGALGSLEVTQITNIVSNWGKVLSTQTTLLQLGPAAFPAAIATTVLLNSISNLLKGDGDEESTCFAYMEASEKTIDEYTTTVQSSYPKEKANAIILLAKMYHEAYGETWNAEFVKDMKKAAGNTILNCKEFSAAIPELTKKLEKAMKEKAEKEKAEKVEEEKDQNSNGVNQEPPKTCSLQYVTKEYSVNVETIDAKTSSWAKLVEQYDCLDDLLSDENKANYPNIKNKNNTLLKIRLLKLAQGINDGDYSEKRMLDLLNRSYQKGGIKDGEPGFDYKLYTNARDSHLIGSVAMPSKLAGCERQVSEDIKADISDKRGTGKAFTGEAYTKTQTISYFIDCNGVPIGYNKLMNKFNNKQ